MSDLRENWTRDADNNLVNWTKEPYLKNGVLNLVLDWEDAREVPQAEFKKRTIEYLSILEKQKKAIIAKRSKEGPYVVKPGGGVARRGESNEK